MAAGSDFESAIAAAFASATGGSGAIGGWEEWKRLIQHLLDHGAISNRDELADIKLAFPMSVDEVMEEARAHAKPDRAAQVDELLADTSRRVDALAPLLNQWGIDQMSREEASGLLGLLEETEAGLRKGSGALFAWHASVGAELGAEHTQALFWDHVDPDAPRRYSPHAYQREQLSAIEKRCARRRLRSFGALPAARAAGGIERVAPLSDPPGAAVQIVRAPYAGVGAADMARLLAEVDAARQLALSAHFPALLGAEHAPRSEPAVSLYAFEAASAPPLDHLVGASGPLSETTLLARHWRRGIVEALFHVSSRTTFLLASHVTLAHARPIERGTRLVLTHLPLGAEFPEAEPAPGREGCDLARARDEQLLADGARMCADLHRAPHSALLRAAVEVCTCEGVPRRPSLAQLLSHPFFTPVADDPVVIAAAYQVYAGLEPPPPAHETPPKPMPEVRPPSASGRSAWRP